MPPEAAAAAPPAPRRHLILSLARPEAYVPMTRSILGRIGYTIVSPSEWRTDPELAAVSPALCLVDERQLGAADELPTAPLVVLCARGRAEFDLAEVSIDTDPELQGLYGEEIPVITINGRKAFKYFVEAEEFLKKLRARLLD